MSVLEKWLISTSIKYVFNILTNELMMRYGIIQSGIWKSEIYTNIVIECVIELLLNSNIGITKEEMDILLFMNEPIALRQIGSLFKNLPSEFTSVFGWKYIWVFWACLH